MDDADREEADYEQVGKQVISVHELVCKSSESVYVLHGFYKIM